MTTSGTKIRTQVRTRTTTHSSAERAAAVPVVMVVLVVCATTLVGVARIGDAAIRRARADAIADVSALAAVDRGEAAAGAVAAASAAEVSAFSRSGDGTVRVLGPVGRQLALDARQPRRQLGRRARVEGREGADDSGLALRDDELGTGCDEHRRRHDGQGERLGQDVGQCHGASFGGRERSTPC